MFYDMFVNYENLSNLDKACEEFITWLNFAVNTIDLFKNNKLSSGLMEKL